MLVDKFDSPPSFKRMVYLLTMVNAMRYSASLLAAICDTCSRLGIPRYPYSTITRAGLRCSNISFRWPWYRSVRVVRALPLWPHGHFMLRSVFIVKGASEKNWPFFFLYSSFLSSAQDYVCFRDK